VQLITEPDDGITPILKAINRARASIDIVIFRLDRAEIEPALAAAVTRGVVVRALIAHTNRGGEDRLRKLELSLLKCGVTVARTAGDLARYHGKMMIVDGTLFVFGFNYTKLDTVRSRSFGIVTRDKRLVKEAGNLFEADRTRQPYSPNHQRLVVSPENSREVLTAFIRRARKQLLIYDQQVSDNLIQRVLQDRVRAGVEVRVIGKIEKSLIGVEARKLPDLRLHVRAMVRDGSAAFVGSQSLRRLEVDGRREIGVIINDSRVAKSLQNVFEADWENSTPRAKSKSAAEPKSLVLRKGALKRLKGKKKTAAREVITLISAAG
jgi:phosphatidylserine/phosphatidylglycerophosphate/cardiolipin synthase-like enzyme